MAKVIFDVIDFAFKPSIEENYGEAAMALIDGRKKTALYVDPDTGGQIALLGKNFRYEGGELVGGKVDQVQFISIDDAICVTAVDFKLKAAAMNDELLDVFGGVDFLSLLLGGNDTIVGQGNGFADFLVGEGGDDILKGKSGNDTLVGNVGNDIMSGGIGNDNFQFFGDLGKDVITDFNVGDGVNFDTILVRNTGFSFGQTTDGDLKIKFDTGAQVILLGVDFDERNDVTLDVIL